MLHIVTLLPPVHIPLFRLRVQRRSVSGGVGEGGGGETDALVGGIEDGVETLEEGVAVDEVETLARVRAEVVDDEVDGAGGATDVGVQRAGEELSVGGQLESSLYGRKG